MQESFININGKEIKVDGILEDFIEPNKMKVNHGYIYDGIYYQYRGQLKKKEIEGSIYYNKDDKEDLFIIDYSENNISKYKVITSDTLFKDDDGTINIDEVLEAAVNCKDKILKQSLKTNYNNVDMTGYLSFDINDNDDDLVSLLKEIINGKRIPLSDIKELGINTNLQYGLRTRHTITFNSLSKWLEILNMEIIFNSIDESQKEYKPSKPDESSVLNISINDHDDDMIRFVKNIIIERQESDNPMTLDELVYRGGNYNMYRGLVIRNSISYDTFIKWGDILGKRFDILFNNLDNTKGE